MLSDITGDYSGKDHASWQKITVSKKVLVAQAKAPRYESGKCLHLQIELDGEKKIVFTESDVLISTIEKVSKDDLPISCQIIQEGEHFEFK